MTPTIKKHQKIRRAARVVAKGYIETLAAGKEPATLAAQIVLGKYDILGNVNDERLNMIATLEGVRREAHFMIKMELELRPELAMALVRFRKARQEKNDAQERQETSRANAPLGRFLANRRS
tara:strand:+ start:7034 stop:7399 length:366 start_codon:yes stop_codon:yes gene_type:complete